MISDSSQYLQSRIGLKSDDGTYTDYDILKSLHDRSTNMLSAINNIIHENRKIEFGCLQNEIDTTEKTSYLNMSLRNYGNYELATNTETLSRTEYVDVTGKTSTEFNEDDNIYDNYIVERKVNGTTAEAMTSTQNSDSPTRRDFGAKHECPFTGLPAAHLTIMHSPKCGWLTMHLRGKRFIRNFSVNFKRKYYTGLVTKQTKNNYCEWWLLMYAGGTCDLKPTVCIQLNQFEVHADHLKDREESNNDNKQESENKRNPCKFELNEKTKRKNSKSYCFVAETFEHCEHWVSLLKQLCLGLPYIESTFITTAQIRKLPMLPLNAKNCDIDCRAVSVDTKFVPNSISVSDVCNHSEGVYEEPEDYYKNVQISTTKTPALPMKQLSQPTASTIRMEDISLIYDTPTRKTHDLRHYDSIQKSYSNETRLEHLEHESNCMKIDDGIFPKQSTHSEEPPKNYSSSVRKTVERETAGTSMNTEMPTSKSQLSAVRKWLFSNHFSKLRHSANSSQFVPIEESPMKVPSPSVQLNQPHETNAIEFSSDVHKRTFNVQPKGNKVHQIINQLEANGQLTLLSGGSSTNKCSVP